MSKLGTITSWISTKISPLKNLVKKGQIWLGVDGVANLSTAAVLTIFFMIFFKLIWAMALTMIVAIGKCIFDKSRGSADEKHDLICAVVGIILGAAIGIVV
jgi:hypothetical protein